MSTGFDAKKYDFDTEDKEHPDQPKKFENEEVEVLLKTRVRRKKNLQNH